MNSSRPASAAAAALPGAPLLLALLLIAPLTAAAPLPYAIALPFSVLPVAVQSWEQAALAYRSGALPPAQTDIHLGHQPLPRYFVARPPWSAPPPGAIGRAPILTLTAANLDAVDLVYVAPDGSLAGPRQHTGDTLPIAERDLSGATLAFHLEPALLTDHALVLRITTIGQLSLVPYLTDAASFAVEQARAFLTGGMLAALAGLFALLMLAAWAATRDRRFIAFVLLSAPFSVTGLAVIGQLPYFLPWVPAAVLGRAASPLAYLVSAALIFSFYLIVRPPVGRGYVRRLWFVLGWLMLALIPIGFTDLHPRIAGLNNGVQLAFIAFVLVYGPTQWRRTSMLGRIALAYLFATCVTGVIVVARTWFPSLASVAVAYFWQLNLLFQSFMLIAVLAVSGSILQAVPRQARRLVRAQREQARLAALAQEFSGLLQVVSHEIRNPASSLRLLAGNLRRGLVSTDEAANDLTHLSGHLADIVAGLHAQRAAFSVSRDADFRYDLGERIKQVQTALGGRLDRARLDIRVTSTVADHRHLIDAPRLALILTNLLDNACKYGGTGRVRARVVSTPQRFVLTVADQGPGLLPGEEAEVFKQFWRAERSRHITGWGLGLWACRNAVEALGGQLRYRRVLPTGAGFRVTVARPDPPQAPP